MVSQGDMGIDSLAPIFATVRKLNKCPLKMTGSFDEVIRSSPAVIPVAGRETSLRTRLERILQLRQADDADG